jgi:hypothetical protein
VRIGWRTPHVFTKERKFQKKNVGESVGLMQSVREWERVRIDGRGEAPRFNPKGNSKYYVEEWGHTSKEGA